MSHDIGDFPWGKASANMFTLFSTYHFIVIVIDYNSRLFQNFSNF